MRKAPIYKFIPAHAPRMRFGASVAEQMTAAIAAALVLRFMQVAFEVTLHIK